MGTDFWSVPTEQVRVTCFRFHPRRRSGQLRDRAERLELQVTGIQPLLEILVDLGQELDFARQYAVNARDRQAARLRIGLGGHVQTACGQGVLHREDSGAGDALVGRHAGLDRGGAHLGVRRRVAHDERLVDRVGEVDQLLETVLGVVGDERIAGAEHFLTGVGLADRDRSGRAVLQILGQNGHGSAGDGGCDTQGENEGGLLHVHGYVSSG